MFVPRELKNPVLVTSRGPDALITSEELCVRACAAGLNTLYPYFFILFFFHIFCFLDKILQHFLTPHTWMHHAKYSAQSSGGIFHSVTSSERTYLDHLFFTRSRSCHNVWRAFILTPLGLKLKRI